MDLLGNILAALSLSLDGLMPGIPIYAEEVPSKVPPRCFLIGFAGGIEITHQTSGRCRVSGKLDITYLAPESKDELEIKKELNRVYAALALNLTVIRSSSVELLIRQHKRLDDGSDGVLHDLCDFVTFLLPINTAPDMRLLELNGKKEI